MRQKTNGVGVWQMQFFDVQVHSLGTVLETIINIDSLGCCFTQDIYGFAPFS